MHGLHLRVEFDERALRIRITATGRIWIAPRRAWELRYGEVLDLSLRNRTIDDTNLDR